MAPFRSGVDVRDVLRYDDYGFAVFSSDSGMDKMDERHHSYCRSAEVLSSVTSSWTKVLNEWDQNNSDVKLRKMVKMGLPSHLRGLVWKALVDADALALNSSFNYEKHVLFLRDVLVKLGVTEFNTSKAERDLGKLENCKDNFTHLPISTLRQILLDVDRTFSTHITYFGDTPAAIEGRAALFRILAIYATFNVKVGYCQGMSYIAAMFLFYVTEEEAFWCLVALFERPKYLQGYFDVALEKIQAHAAIFDRILHHKMPKLRNHLNILGVDPLLYITPWFMSLYTSLPCWDTVLFIWDLLLLEGIQAIFRVGLGIMQLLQTSLLESDDPNVVIPMIQRLSPDIVNLDALLPIVWKTRVEKWEITSLQAVVTEEKKPLVSRSLRKKHSKRDRTLQRGQSLPAACTVTPKKSMKVSKTKPTLMRRLRNIFSSQSGEQSDNYSPTGALNEKYKLSSQVLYPSVRSVHGSLRVMATESPKSWNRILGSSAMLQHTFLEFHTSTPFRSDGENCSPVMRTSPSPEVEMKTVRKKGKPLKCRRSLLSADLWEDA